MKSTLINKIMKVADDNIHPIPLNERTTGVGSNTGIDTWRDSVSDYLIDRTEDRAANDNPVPRDFRS